MKLSIGIVFGALAMVGSAAAASIAYFTPLRQVVYPAAHVYSAHSSSLQTPSQQQYHTQDEFGQYAYGYREPLSSKQEVRSLDGITRGSYSYRDAEGKIQTVAYTADDDGFHVAATNLPRAISSPQQSNSVSAPITSSPAATDIDSDTVEITAARAANIPAHETTQLRLATIGSTSTINQSGLYSTASDNVRSMELPYPVEDTPTVAMAKAEHLKRFEQEKLRNEIIGGTSSNIIPSTAVMGSIIPAIYNYGYPLNAQVIASRYFY